jgi:hypothetical protein
MPSSHLTPGPSSKRPSPLGCLFWPSRACSPLALPVTAAADMLSTDRSEDSSLAQSMGHIGLTEAKSLSRRPPNSHGSKAGVTLSAIARPPATSSSPSLTLPLSPETTLAHFSHLLTPYEMSEIQGFRQIYFAGSSTVIKIGSLKRPTGSSLAETCNVGGKSSKADDRPSDKPPEPVNDGKQYL